MFLRDQMIGEARELSDWWLAGAFDEGARYRAANDPLHGFPVPGIADLFSVGA